MDPNIILLWLNKTKFEEKKILKQYKDLNKENVHKFHKFNYILST